MMCGWETAVEMRIRKVIPVIELTAANTGILGITFSFEFVTRPEL